MPAWKEARRAGQTAKHKQQKERTSPAVKAGVGRYNFEDKRCLWCSEASGLRTGFLPITGRVWFCSGCKDRYEEDKKWERTL